MSDYGTMKSRISNEMERSDLLSNGVIANAIQDAIKLNKRKRFWFNESRDLTFNTVASQRIYTSADASWIASVIHIDHLFITVGGQNRCLRRRDAAEIELMADNAALVGEPYSWAYWNKSIQLYPIPQQAYTVRAYAHIELDELEEDSDTNAWMTDAEMFIRNSAKAIAGIDGRVSSDEISGFMTAAQVALDALDEETGRRQATGCVTATQF